MQDRQTRMGTAPLVPLMISFSLPAIVGMMVQALYNMADRFFIGQTGQEEGALAIAGITVGFPFMLLLMGFGMLVGIGGTSAFSILLGQKKHEEAETVLGNSLSLLVLTMAVLTVAGLAFLDPLLRAFGASEAVLPYARDYLRIVMYGAVVNGIGFGMNNFIRADGSPKTAMVTMFIGALLNVILDPILILGFDMGVAGAAWATVISQTVSAVWVMAYFFSRKSHVRLHRRNLALRPGVVGRIVAIGLAPFIMQVAAGGINLLLNRQLLAYGGDLAISALGIIYSVAMLFMMPIFGINQGSAPIIGYNYGARHLQRVRQAARITVLAATALVTLGFILVQLFPRQFLGAFNQNPQLLDLGAQAARWFFLFFPFLGLQIAGTGYFQAVGKPREAMVLSLSRQVLFLVPAVLVLPLFLGLQGVWLAIPVADGLASLVTGFLFFREMGKLKREACTGGELPADGCLDPVAAVDFADPVNNKGEII